MPRFDYTALDARGARVHGTVDAAGEPAAAAAVLALGLHPLRLGGDAAAAPSRRETRPGAAARSRVRPRDVEAFCRELAHLLAAGVPLARALAILAREAASDSARALWHDVRERVTGGGALAEALAAHPREFPGVEVAMVQAGEQGGFLHLVLGQIADLRTRERDLADRVRAAMVYPAVLMVLMVAVVAFLLTYFIPRFTAIFADFGAELPVLTQVLLGASDVIRGYALPLAAAIAGGALLLRRSARTPAGSQRLAALVLRVPGIGRAVARFALVRFARMLGTLTGAGVPLDAALRTARDAIGNPVLQDAVGRAIDDVRGGEGLARSLATCPALFPPSVLEIIAVAEETGRIDSELVRLADVHEAELDRHLRMLVALLEPTVLLLMAALVGTIVVGMLLPVLTLQDLIQ
jgi:type II secretory pathway component PulF